MKRRSAVKLFAALMALVIILASLPLAAHAEETTIHMGIFSDVHIFADSLKGNNCQAYKDFTVAKSKEYAENYSLVNNALEGVLKNAKNDGADYLLVPGDLTKDGEYESHLAIAKMLEDWQTETGIPVFVINGNHDINNSNACTFVNGVKEEARKTTPEEFREIYANLGYDKADAFFTPKGYSEDYDGIKGGMLSYAADLGDAYRLIAVDTGIYSVDNGAKETEHLTDGQVGNDLLAWVVAQAQQAKADGKVPLVMQHHNLVPHMDIEEATFWAFVTWDWERIADAYADAGIHYLFSGHLHNSDTSSYVNDNGEEITDILSPTLTGYPNNFKTLDITTDGENITVDMVTHDIDEYSPVVSENGKVYPKPYRLTSSMDQTFGNDIGVFVERLLKGVVDDYFTQIQEAGGLIKFLAGMGIDVQSLLIDLIGTNGLAVGKANILTVSGNAMSFINDLDNQIMENYVNDPKGTLDKVMALINKLLAFKVSDYPCTLNAELLGSEYYTGKPCTLGEYATSALLLFYGGDENKYYGQVGYEYLEDAINRFDSGESAEGIFTLLIDVLLNDLIQDEILGTLNFNFDSLFPEGTAFWISAKLTQMVIEKLLGGNNSYLNLINSVLGLDVVPEGYNSINDILNTLVIDRYLTPSQYESWGATIAWMVKSLIFDVNPTAVSDNNVVLTYTGKQPVEATKENYRLPNNVVMGLTEDNTTSVTITWVTKYSITDTDIELVDYSVNPEFKGKPTKDKRVGASYTTSVRSYPGADLGIFGLFDLEKDYIKHVVTLTGLTPGAKYNYRVGSASYGWWSDVGTITTSKGDDEAFTFINITDPQAQRPSHYETYGKVMDEALRLYPEARFTVSCGDQVDFGTTSKHWNYFFNSSPSFMSLPFMPATGNHEKKGEVLKTNFTLPGVPDQDENTGTYYSYDYNGVHFTVLNTNDMVDKKLSDKQIEWLKNDISSSDANWKVVILHKAMYANGIYYKDKETVNLRQQLSVLLPSLNVDLVLQGHNHVYTRTDVMKANCIVPTNTEVVSYNGADYKMKIDPKGTIYSIICSAGVKEYTEAEQKDCDKYYPAAECVVENDYPMFSAITVDGGNLYYSAYQIKDGKAQLADSFGIKKTVEPSKTLFDKLIDAVLSKLNIKYSWKIGNFFMKILAPIIKLIQKF